MIPKFSKGQVVRYQNKEFTIQEIIKTHRGSKVVFCYELFKGYAVAESVLEFENESNTRIESLN